MKKILFLLVTSMLCVSTYAGKVLVENGSISVLNENETCLFELDLTDAKFDHKKDFKKWCGPDYAERVRLMEEAFPEAFNERNSEGLKIVLESNTGNPKYKMVLHCKDFVRDVFHGGFGGARAKMKVYGTLKIIEISTGKIVLEIGIDKIKGGGDFVETDRFPKTMKELAKQVVKLKK